MKLDSRILEGKRPLTCIDVEQAREFVGKECIFSDFFLNYVDIEKFNIDNDNEHTGILSINDNSSDYIFINDRNESRYRFILPCEWVKPEEHEEIYRAFSLNEFSELYAIGDVVTFRLKDCEVIEQSMLIGFQSSHDEDIPGNGFVLIGNCRYGFMELFNNYELKYLDHWQPFGIEVEE